MNKYLACRNHFYQMVKTQHQLALITEIPELTLYDLIDRFHPHFFIHYNRLRLIPVVWVMIHPPDQAMRNPFVRLWGTHESVHLYFGNLPTKPLLELKRDSSLKVWIDEIQREHIVIPRNARVNMSYEKRLQKYRNENFEKYLPYNANLLFDLIQQITAKKTIRELAPRYQSIITLASMCSNNDLFELDFPYTITQFCDFKILLVVQKRDPNLDGNKSQKPDNINALKRYNETKELQHFIRELSKFTQFIHYYECARVFIFEVFGYNNQLDAFRNYLFTNNGQNKILLSTLIPPPFVQPTLICPEIRSLYTNQWDYAAISTMIRNDIPKSAELIDFEIIVKEKNIKF